MAHHGDYLQKVAGTILDDGGTRGMTEAVEALSGEVAHLAPVELGDLRASAHPTVTSGDEVVYDRAPLQHRLTEEELKVKAKARDALERLNPHHKGGEITGSGINSIKG